MHLFQSQKSKIKIQKWEGLLLYKFPDLCAIDLNEVDTGRVSGYVDSLQFTIGSWRGSTLLSKRDSLTEEIGDGYLGDGPFGCAQDCPIILDGELCGGGVGVDDDCL